MRTLASISKTVVEFTFPNEKEEPDRGEYKSPGKFEEIICGHVLLQEFCLFPFLEFALPGSRS